MTINLRELPRSTTTIEFCEQEAIHTPNFIQAHGAVLVADAATRCITHASANLERMLGRTPASVMGRLLEDVLGKAALPLIEAEAADGAGSIGELVAVRGNGDRMLNVQAHHTGSRIFIDLQPAMDVAAGSPMPAFGAVLEAFMHASTRAQLSAFAANGLRAVSGFDRVMVYRFGPGGDGEIIAESKADHLVSLLGLTYPAADIPPQARALFLRNRVGAIADTGYTPVPLLVATTLDDDAPLDMTRSALRGISPIHCEYLRNMNVGASLSISLVHGEKLWGLIVCHHGTPRVTGPELRSVAKLLGQVMSLLIGSLSETEAYTERVKRQNSLHAIVEAMADDAPLLQALRDQESALLDLVEASGAIVRVSGTIIGLGRLPPPTVQSRTLALLDTLAGGTIVGVDDLGVRLPELAGSTSAASGALIMPFGLGEDNAILWFRPELNRNIIWGGDPHNHHSIDAVTGRLTPRGSFEAWNETTSGRSAPWSEANLALAGDLRIAIESEIAARASAGLARLRHFDPLTGLSNRRRLEERLAEISAIGASGPTVGVLFLDLDRFKVINDSMGHAAGDLLLVHVAERLLAVTGSRHLVARLGGDEFVVLAIGLSRASVGDLADAICVSLAQPFDLDGHSAHVSVSIGLAMADEVGTLNILQAADMAMYEAKQDGGNGAATFQQSLHDQAVRKFELDHDLRMAINETEQLMLVYQPLCDINDADHTLLGFEALLRWRHPRLGWVSPDMFIPIAEKSGLIVKLGDWIMVTAIQQARTMRDVDASADLLMTINISVLQLGEPGFCERLACILNDAGVPPSAICLEVTESMISDQAIAAVLRNIRSLGVKIAIDDFGTGYSSLSYLRRLPADIVKLDASFLEDSDASARDVDFIGAIVALIHAAGMSVIQEGVETLAQCINARASGADMVQGFMFSRPLLAPDAMKLAEHGRVAPTLLGSSGEARTFPKDLPAIAPPSLH